MLLRQEVLTTRDIDKYWEIKNLLTKNNIKSFTVTNTMTNPGRHHGTPFINAAAAYQYHIFVKRKDYKLAKKLLNL